VRLEGGVGWQGELGFIARCFLRPLLRKSEFFLAQQCGLSSAERFGLVLPAAPE
jgi:hypothetical protein